MTITEMRLHNPQMKSPIAEVDTKNDFVDRSDILFSYMNMIAFNNKIDLKIN